MCNLYLERYMGFRIQSCMRDWRYKRSTCPSFLKTFHVQGIVWTRLTTYRWRQRQTTATKTVSKRVTRHKIVLQADATKRGCPATHIIDSSTGWTHCSQGHSIVSISCLKSAAFWKLHPCLPTFAIQNKFSLFESGCRSLAVLSVCRV